MTASKAPNEPPLDLVCGMTVTPATAAGSLEYNGKEYYFCAQAA
jgi:Cu+-exporting ATPase